MKNFVAIVSWTPDGRIAKYMDFATEAEAAAHVDSVAGRYPDAFVAANPGGGIVDWRVDPAAKTVIYDLAEKAHREESEVMEAKKQAEQHERFLQTVKYENRIVAFVDVLGWRDFVTRSVRDAELVRSVGSMLVVQDRFRQELREVMKRAAPDSAIAEPDLLLHEVSQFSDSFILSCRPDHHSTLPMQLQALTMQMLGLGLLMRGGIAHGLAYHRGSVAFGPAVTKAYELEQVATYPRVVLDVALDAEFFPGRRVQNKDGKPLGHFKTWRRDHDGRAFLDFLQPITANTWQQISPAHTQKHFARPRQIISELFARYRAHSALSGKYYWLAKYFNGVLAEYPDVTVEPIALR